MTTVSKLYPFQTEDVKWLIQHPRCILGSEMGVGKTVEFLHLCKQLDVELALVICPKSLIAEWNYQIEEWLGKEWLERFIVLNYEKLRNPDLLFNLTTERWDAICFDECHKLKNPRALQTKGAFRLRGNHIVMMSGTPQQNGPQDLFSLLKIVSPNEYKSYWRFAEEFTHVIPLTHIHPYARMITGAKNKDKLNTILHQHMLRRTKEEVLPDLPPKIYRTIPVELDPDQYLKYKQMEDKLFVLLDSGEKITAPQVIAQTLRLRQLCLEPNLLSEDKHSTPSVKTKLILDLVDSTDEQIVIFTFFEQYTRILSNELTRNKVSHVLYTGKIDVTERRKSLDDFQQGKAQVLMGTITTMGLGITLTASHIVIFADLWWNPAVNEQCVDRLHRIGQNSPVEVIDLWCKRTVEDAVHRIIRRKEKYFNDIVATKQVINELRTIRRTSNE